MVGVVQKMWGTDRRWHISVLIVSLTHVLVLIGLRSDLIVQLSRVPQTGSCGISTSIRSHCSSDAMQRRKFNLLGRETNEVPHPVASVVTYEGRDRGINPISVVTECDWHSKGRGRPVTSDNHADPEG